MTYPGAMLQSLVVLIAKHGGSAAVSECGTIVRAALADCIVRTAIVTQVRAHEAQPPRMLRCCVGGPPVWS